MRMDRAKSWPWLLACLAAAPPPPPPTGFAPGRWEHRTTLLTADVPGIPQWLIKLAAGRGTRSSCATTDQLQRAPETLLQGDDSALCKTRQFSMANGRLVYDTFCTNARFPQGLLVASRGAYTPTSYSISTTSTGTKDGKPVRILTTGSGRRTAPGCS